MEHRGQVLDLPAPDAELGLAAAVDLDPALGAVVVGREELLGRAEARRLDVDRARREREALDVRDGVDRRVPGDAVAVGLEHGVGFGVGQVRVLEPRVRERLGDAPVERRVRVDVDGRALVGALEVDRRDRSGGRQPVDQRLVPVRGAVELEAQPGVHLEPPADRVEARRAADPQRRDEVDRRLLAPERLRQRLAALAQREVERGALHRPAAVEAEGGHSRLAVGEEVERAHVLAEGPERPRALERQVRAARLLGALVLGAVGDVLPEPLLAGALQVEGGGDALELIGDAALAALQRVAVDRQRQLGDAIEGGHDGTRH